MATMSGSAFLPGSPPGRSDDGLFAELVASNPRKSSIWRGFPASVTAHLVIIAAAILIPIFWGEAPPEHPDYIRAIIYNPPPPPPPPLPKGSALIEKPEPSKPVTEETRRKPDLTPPDDTPRVAELRPEDRPPASEQAGSPTGSDFGMAEGMEGGVEGGQVGGVPGGVLGGVVGGTGDGPVMDYDQPPRPIKITRPQYPQEAFVKKVEGTVVVEILIDASGRVVRARVIQSIPLLDAAALQTVYQWIFSPAIKGGRSVATVAHAPVQFRIY